MDTLELKGMVEGYSAWLGAQKFGPELIAELEEILRQMAAHIHQEESRRFFRTITASTSGSSAASVTRR